MNWTAYPEYKNSGVEWLDEIPTHWHMQKLRRLCSMTTGWTPPSVDDDSYLGDNPWANISDLGPRILVEPAKQISDSAIAASRIPISPRGSLLFSFKLSVGRVSFAGRDMYTNEAIATFLESEELALRFAYYSFPVTLVENANENIYGAKLLNQELIYSARVPVPSMAEQLAVADFLDRETTKIDALIEKQNQLISTLREDRTATITHAVTKGLNPDAAMRDSRDPVLPSLPVHWELRALKHLGDLVTGSTPSTGELTNYTEEEGFPWFRPEDLDTSGRPSVASRSLSVSGRATVPYIRSPAVLVVAIGTLGKTGYIEVDGSSNQQITAIVGASSAKFVFYALVASHSQIWAASMSNTIPIISAGRLGAVKLPVPTVSEQIQIAAFLENQCARIDALISKATEVVVTLREYRSALINAAVTGKIDVREAS